MAGHDTYTADGKRFLAEIEKLKHLQVRIGFQAGAAEEDGVDMTDIALWNEVGTVSSPARPFMRNSVDENKDQISAMCKEQMRRLCKGGTAQSALQSIGAYQKGLVQEKIVNGSFVPNAPSTIRRKKSDKPLIDSGTMRQSVNFVIKEKGSE